MSQTSDRRSDEFLKIADQFKLGALTTEGSHPVTADLSEVARRDIAAGLKQLFQVDQDVIEKFSQMVASGRLPGIADTVVERVRGGGKLFFTGCGSTGRLSIQLVSIWRDFWRQFARTSPVANTSAQQFEQRAFSVMAGGDFALIKAVEGFEDFTAFGKRQIRDLGVSDKDVVFAITEGGETSFVIGTAWEGLESGAKVYFVYNNPDDVLCQHVQRSREVIQEPRIEKINLTTGPMSITGSTRMQATTIQLCVLLTVLEMAVRKLSHQNTQEIERVPQQFLEALRKSYDTLCSPELLKELASLVAMEEAVYRAGGKNNYFASRFGIDVLTDTTERSPTYCTPPFRKFDDTSATESWAFLFVPFEPTRLAWEHILKRTPKCVQWTPDEVLALVGPEKAPRTNEIVARISEAELMRFRIGMDGLNSRAPQKGGSAVCIVASDEVALAESNGFFGQQLSKARQAGSRTGAICVENSADCEAITKALQGVDKDAVIVRLLVPDTGFLLDGVTRAALKMLLNSLSTCTMVRLGRVMGNYMIWVVASNLKLIDRATRYIQRLTEIEYQAANRLLFEVIEYVEPRMKADRAYPPVVGLAVTRARHGLGNEAAEERLMKSIG